MGEFASQAGRKMIAVVILVVAAYILFKLLLGFVMAVVWIAVLVLAVVAIGWAIKTL
jgi:hypothetical protein